MADIYPVLVSLLLHTESPLLLNVGSHFGQDTLKLRTLFPRANIFMFEPDPRNINVIKTNMKRRQAELIKAAKDHLDLVPWVKFEQKTNVIVIKLATLFAQRKLERIDLI